MKIFTAPLKAIMGNVPAAICGSIPYICSGSMRNISVAFIDKSAPNGYTK